MTIFSQDVSLNVYYFYSPDKSQHGIYKAFVLLLFFLFCYSVTFVKCLCWVYEKTSQAQLSLTLTNRLKLTNVHKKLSAVKKFIPAWLKFRAETDKLKKKIHLKSFIWHLKSMRAGYSLHGIYFSNFHAWNVVVLGHSIFLAVINFNFAVSIDLYSHYQ